MYKTGDIIGLEYHRIAELRGKPDLTPDERWEISHHDAEERRLEEDPKEVMREANNAISRGTKVLLKLVRSRKLRCQILGTNGGVVRESDEAGYLLRVWQEGLIREVVRMADQGVPGTEESIFDGAKTLTEAFIRLAQLHPEGFISMARRTAFMPSLRARTPEYTADAAAIASAIHLGEDHPAPDIKDNRTRAGAHCHTMVAELLRQIQKARDGYYRLRKDSKDLREFDEMEAEYHSITVEENKRCRKYPLLFHHMSACAQLGELRDDAERWWSHRVLPMVKEAFNDLAKRPQSNPVLWEELGKGGETHKDSLNDRRRYLEKLCKNKFDQIVKSARRMPAHGQHG